MSETIEHGATGEPVSEDDLRRMLAESRGQIEVLTRERDTERSTRVMTEAERDAERAARVITESERDGSVARAASESEQRYNAEKEAVKNGIAAQKAVVETAEEAYARHLESGDFKAAAAAQRQMTEAVARMDRLSEKFDYLETNKEKLLAPPPAPRRDPPVVQPTDRLSQLINGRIEPSEREWLTRRPKFLDDPGYRNQVFGASQMATGRGYARGSEPYFREMEKILGENETRTETPAPRHEEPRHQERAPSADITPQRRASPGQDPVGSKQIRLTADQREVADGLYGQPNMDGYIADEVERYTHYYNNLQRRIAAGRM